MGTPANLYDLKSLTLTQNEPQPIGAIGSELYLYDAASDAIEIAFGRPEAWRRLPKKTGVSGPELGQIQCYIRSTAAAQNAIQLKLGSLRYVDGRLDLTATTGTIGADLRVAGAAVTADNPVPVTGPVTTEPAGTHWQALVTVAGGADADLAAAVAGQRRGVQSLILRETAGAAAVVELRDGAAAIARFDLAASGQLAISLPAPIRSAVGAALRIAVTGGGASVDVTGAGWVG